MSVQSRIADLRPDLRELIARMQPCEPHIHNGRLTWVTPSWRAELDYPFAVLDGRTFFLLRLYPRASTRPRWKAFTLAEAEQVFTEMKLDLI